MQSYLIAVDYRTSTNCNTTTVKVIAPADNPDEAFRLASAKVARRRGVVKVDGGTMLGSPLPLTRAEWRTVRAAKQ